MCLHLQVFMHLALRPSVATPSYRVLVRLYPKGSRAEPWPVLSPTAGGAGAERPYPKRSQAPLLEQRRQACLLLLPRGVCGRSLQLLGRGRQLLQPTATPSRSCPELARLSGPSPARLEPVEPPCEPDATDGLGLGSRSGLGLGLGL